MKSPPSITWCSSLLSKSTWLILLLEKPRKRMSNFSTGFTFLATESRKNNGRPATKQADPSKRMHEYAHYSMKGWEFIVSKQVLENNLSWSQNQKRTKDNSNAFLKESLVILECFLCKLRVGEQSICGPSLLRHIPHPWIKVWLLCQSQVSWD